MRTPLQNCNREPFALPSNVMLFHDWRWVNHGYPLWRGPDGQAVPMFHPRELPPIHFERGDSPHGLALRAVPARKSDPFLAPTGAEGIIGCPRVMRDGSTYRLWYEAVPADCRGGGHENVLCYAQSDDGRSWTRPDVGKVLTGRNGNVVFGGELAGEWGYHGGGVFEDPAAPEAERFKVVYLGRMDVPQWQALAAEYPGRVSPGHSWDAGAAYAACAAVSPDGLRWTRLPVPVSLHMSDTHNTAYYDTQLRKYVWFCRTWTMGRRSIGRSVSDDFREFAPPETVLWPGADVTATATWYGNGKTLYPGTVDYHLLLPWRWQVSDDRFQTHLLTSPDAILWTAPPGNLVLAPGERGQWDTGGVISGCGMVELPGGEIGVPFVGYRVPHKYPRKPPLGQFAWALWRRDRLVALEADETGEFSTWLVQPRGRQLRMNVQTKFSGHVRVEVLGLDRRPLPGRSLEDCDVIDGDFDEKVVTWRGDSDMRGRPDDGPVAFRIAMQHARLFSLRFA